MTGLDRRGFVKVAAGGAAMLSGPLAYAQQKAQIVLAKAVPQGAVPPVGPTNWAQFRSELKKRNQPGVIVLLQSLPPAKNQLQPKGDPKEQAKEEAKQKAAIAARLRVQPVNNLAAQIHAALFNCGNSELPVLLTQAVFIAAPIEQVRKEFPTLAANTGLALVDVDGKVVATMPVDQDLGNKFASRAAELLFGKNDEKLAARVKAERDALGQAACQKLDTAIVDLDNDDFSRRQEASQTLNDLFSKIPASMVQAHRTAPSLEVRTRIDSLFRKKLHDQNSAGLLQTSLAPYAGAINNFDVRVLCGQGALQGRAHEFVQRWSI